MKLENKCTSCAHSAVCKFKKEFAKKLKELEEWNNKNGQMKIEVQCEHYMGRSGSSNGTYYYYNSHLYDRDGYWYWNGYMWVFTRYGSYSDTITLTNLTTSEGIIASGGSNITSNNLSTGTTYVSNITSGTPTATIVFGDENED